MVIGDDYMDDWAIFGDDDEDYEDSYEPRPMNLGEVILCIFTAVFVGVLLFVGTRHKTPMHTNDYVFCTVACSLIVFVLLGILYLYPRPEDKYSKMQQQREEDRKVEVRRIEAIEKSIQSSIDSIEASTRESRHEFRQLMMQANKDRQVIQQMIQQLKK